MPLAAQTPTAPVTRGYTIFFRGVPVGREDVSVRAGLEGTTITSQGRTTSPANVALERVEIRYGAGGSPEAFTLQGSLNGGEVELRTVFKDGSAITQGSQQGKTVAATHAVSPQAIVLANGVWAGFAALPPVLARAAPGFQFRVFLLPLAEIGARVEAIADDKIQQGTTLFTVRRYDLIFSEVAGDLALSVTTSLEGSLLRISIPAQSLEVVRADLAGAAARTNVHSNAGDQATLIPAQGFNLGATITVPSGAPAAPPAGAVAASKAPQGLPAVVLVAGSSAPDRDELAPAVPAMAQMAAALAEAGFITVRFDRRGSGQSGGRAESATLNDYSEDVRTIVRWLSARKDVDARRIAVVGHGEGAWNAMLAASKENRIAALATIGAGATTGADLIAEQQRIQLERSNVSAAERAQKEALQKQVHTAVLTGKGWDQVPPEMRRQADTPWFQSLLAFDPAKTVKAVDVPILIVHGDLDHEVPVAHAERLAGLARVGDSESVELVTVRGVNHVLMRAFTGEVNEYRTLTDRNISPDVTAAVVAWLKKSLPVARSR